MTRWFTADHHFGHKNAIEYCKRPFDSVEEMDQAMYEIWNSLIMPNDEVFYLGDLSFHNKEKTKALLNNLNGRIYLVQGNHDYSRKYHNWDRFEWVKDYYEIKIRNLLDPSEPLVKVVLCHYPFEHWNKSHRGSWHLHGHQHGEGSHRVHRMDVGADTNYFRPYSESDVIERLGWQFTEPLPQHHARKTDET